MTSSLPWNKDTQLSIGLAPSIPPAQFVAALNKADPKKLLPALAITQEAYYQSLIDAGHRKALAAKAAGDKDWARFEQVKFKAGWFARAAWIG